MEPSPTARRRRGYRIIEASVALTAIIVSIAALVVAREQVSLRTCYCSVLDDCWVFDTREQDPEPIETCEAEALEPQYR